MLFLNSFYSSLKKKKEMKTVNITTLPNNCRHNIELHEFCTVEMLCITRQ